MAKNAEDLIKFPVGKLKDCEELYLHGLGKSISKLVNPRRLDIGKSQRLYYYWIKNHRPIKIKDLKKITNNTQFLSLLDEIKCLSAYSSPHIINLPNTINKELAYLCGYHVGDGCICKNCLTIHYMDCKEQLIKISEIYKKIFGLSLTIRKDPRKKAYNATITSKALVYILHYCLGLPIGKKGKLKFLNWINNSLKKDFMVGFLDAEFGINRKKYQFSGSSIDKEFMCILQKELKNLGLDLKLYGPYSCIKDPNPRWFLKTSKVATMYLLKKMRLC